MAELKEKQVKMQYTAFVLCKSQENNLRCNYGLVLN